MNARLRRRLFRAFPAVLLLPAVWAGQLGCPRTDTCDAPIGATAPIPAGGWVARLDHAAYLGPDVDGDGRASLVWMCDDSEGGLFGALCWREGRIEGDFPASSPEPWRWEIEPLGDFGCCTGPLSGADIDSDGVDDLATVAHGTADETAVYLIPGASLGGEIVERRAVESSPSRHIAFGALLRDVDGDGIDEIFAQGSGYAALFQPEGDVPMTADDGADLGRGFDFGYYDYREPELALGSVGDVDEDGYNDLVSRRWKLYPGGPRLFGEPTDYLIAVEGQCMVAYNGDFNADGHLDVAAGLCRESPMTGSSLLEDGAAAIWFGPVRGLLDVTSADVVLTGQFGYGSYGESIAVGDVDASGAADLVVGYYQDRSPHRGDTGDGFVAFLDPGLRGCDALALPAADVWVNDTQRIHELGRDMALFDNDGDGILDLVVDGGESNDPPQKYPDFYSYVYELGPLLNAR